MSNESNKPAPSKALTRSSGSRFVTWKWWIVVVFVALPMAVTLAPTALLRIVIVNLSEWVEAFDDFLHGIFGKPFDKAKAWSKRKHSSENKN